MTSLQDNLLKINKLPQNKAFVEIIKVAFFFPILIGIIGIIRKSTDILGLSFQDMGGRKHGLEGKTERETDKQIVRKKPPF